MLFPPSACARRIVKVGAALLVDADGAVRRGRPAVPGAPVHRSSGALP